MLTETEIKPINEYLAVEYRTYENGGKKSTNRRLIPNPATMAKAVVLCHAKIELPYAISAYPCDLNAPYDQWVAALQPNSAVSIKDKEAFRKDVLALDFWKYDDQKADELIEKHFTYVGIKRAVRIEAEDIELGEENPDNE